MSTNVLSYAKGAISKFEFSGLNASISAKEGTIFMKAQNNVHAVEIDKPAEFRTKVSIIVPRDQDMHEVFL